jgi:hypothetical protein
MKKLTVVWAAGISLVGLALLTGQVGATADEATNSAVNKVADLLEKGNKDSAVKAANDVASKYEVEDIMNVFGLRKKKGIGIGPKANEITPDGIEKKMELLASKGITAADLQKEGPALARAGLVITAVGNVILAKAPAKDVGKQKKSDWVKWSQELMKSSEELTAAAKASNVGEFKKAAVKVQQTCDSCHAVFK